MSSKTYVAALAEAMSSAMADHNNTIIIGQGISDFKGLFGTTMGLKDIYSNRVIESPIAEDSIAGICIGAALNGLYPINTHIRADFGLLVFNQLINLAAKYRYMFGGLFEVPLMMRMVIGRSWGQGAQHSQSLQSMLAHIPGLVVVMPSNPSTILASYRYAINEHRGPVVMLEHRLMYDLEFDDIELDSISGNPLFGSLLLQKGLDFTIIATSVMVVEARRAAKYLEEFGITADIIDLHSISHPDKTMILESVRKTKKLMVLDTSWQAYGVSAEIGRIICEYDPALLSQPMISLGMQPAPCPTAKVLEDMYYPDVHDIVKAALILVKGSIPAELKLPPKQSMTDFYKHFKGPF
jgi:pyruvate/2-oxoglutarate/acetoin dehydrogenase E1 component